MNTLSTSDIFSNFDFYQRHYLSILADAQQYYTPVSDAYIHIWPFARVDLCLGDVLQLWLSEKWRVPPAATPCNEPSYVYQLTGNALTGRNQSQVWHSQTQQTETVSLAHLLRYYAYYQATNHQVLSAEQLQGA